MRLIDEIVKQQIDFLHQKGFDERSLNSPYAEGWIDLTLKSHMSTAIKNMYYDKSPTDFVIKPLAHFDDERSVVKFELFFHFDPKATTLSINRLDLKSKSNTISIHLQKDTDLPHAKEAYQLLLLERTGLHSRASRQVLPKPQRKGKGI